MSFYTNEFKKLQPNHDPRHVEAFIRLEYSTLDHMDRETLKNEAGNAAHGIDYYGVEIAEALAQSYGL
ncbi:MAG TPA: hypothetical protein VFM97_00315 [Gammaproteobacteria bacterium]|nr:hypothetical protein [Gammaproteobacteria bacterium]